MNEAGYDLVAHKHYRERVINIIRVRSERFVKRDRKLRGVFIRGQLVRSLFIFHSITLDEHLRILEF